MAKKKPSALEALTRHDEERLAMQTKGAELRRAAALELGLIVLDAGGSRLGADALRRLIADAVAAPSQDRPARERAGKAAVPRSGAAVENEENSRG